METEGLIWGLLHTETPVSSVYPNWRQVGCGKALGENGINACFIPFLLLASAYGCGLTQDTGTDGLLVWADVAGLMYQKATNLYLNAILCNITSL